MEFYAVLLVQRTDVAAQFRAKHLFKRLAVGGNDMHLDLSRTKGGGDLQGHVTGAWGIPAGAIDPGETARMAAARELLEETGLSVEVGALAEIPVLYQARIARKVGVAQFSLRAFVSHDFGGSLRASDEGIPRWVQLDRVGSLEGLLPNTAEIVDAAASLVRG